MSKLSIKFSDNSKKPIVISRVPLTWLQHAQNHFNSGVSTWDNSVIVDSCEEQLMFLCLFSHVGMFDCQHSGLNVTA